MSELSIGDTSEHNELLFIFAHEKHTKIHIEWIHHHFRNSRMEHEDLCLTKRNDSITKTRMTHPAIELTEFLIDMGT